jgi:N-acetylglutamate synthase-like GNAT family acetyltransferase
VGSTHLDAATAADLPEILDLLVNSGLPVEDVPSIVDVFVVARSGSAMVGVAALERWERVGLLRSVAVAQDARGRGVAGQLCERLMTDAARSGVELVYLLTTDAESYFHRLRFQVAEREQAPEAIRRTREFSELCPDSAVLMCRRLERSG